MIVCARLQYVHARRCQPAIYLGSFCYRHAYFAQLRRRCGTENTLTSIRDVMRSHDIFRNARRKRGGRVMIRLRVRGPDRMSLEKAYATRSVRKLLATKLHPTYIYLSIWIYVLTQINMRGSRSLRTPWKRISRPRPAYRR